MRVVVFVNNNNDSFLLSGIKLIRKLHKNYNQIKGTNLVLAHLTFEAIAIFVTTHTSY